MFRIVVVVGTVVSYFGHFGDIGVKIIGDLPLGFYIFYITNRSFNLKDLTFEQNASTSTTEHGDCFTCDWRCCYHSHRFIRLVSHLIDLY